MNRLLRPGPTTLLATTQAGHNLTWASTAWMLSGLTPSPLINGLLPAFGTLPLLLQVRRDPKGYGLQLMAVLMLIAITLGRDLLTLERVIPVIGCFAAILLLGLGKEMSTLPLQRQLLNNKGTSMPKLRSGQDLGALIGNLLAALLLPGLRQFLPALLLLLPMTRVAAASRNTLETQSPSYPTERLPLDSNCILQGLVMGSLFALLALWVREVDGGKCFDFAMLLAAYGLGRTGMSLLPDMHRSLRYLLIGALLLIIQTSLPPVVAVVLFVPMGALAAASDTDLVDQLSPLGDAPLRWQVLLRSSAIGGIAGSIGLGLTCQLFSLAIALPLVIAGFLVQAITAWRMPPSAQKP